MRKEEKTKAKLEKLEQTIGVLSEKPKEEKTKKVPTFFTSEVLGLLIITMIVSLLMGGIITYKFIINSSEFVDKELQGFIRNYEYIIDNYYDEINKEELLDAALEGMLNHLDKNSIYLEEESSDNFNKQLNGSYEGFGIEIYNDEDGNIVIANVYDKTSAAQAGLKAGDILVKFKDQDLKNVSTTDFVNMVEKTGSKEIELTYSRDGQETTVTLHKQTVTLNSVASEIINKDNRKIGYIRISIFASNTDKQFTKHLEELEKQNIDSLIIDLRNNSGGHLSAVTNMISQFLDSSHVIYQIKIKDKITKTYSNGNKNKDYKIAVLVDNASASASEIMTSALKEQYKAIVVGVKTYGKGTVQEVQDLPNGDKYKFTTKEWLTSNGKKIQGKGIEPDVKVALDDAYYSDPSDTNDNQLQAALSELTK